MPTVPVLNVSGEKVSEIELKDSVFGIEINTHVMHAVVKNYLANQRQGTQSTKTRAEVRGGGRKPWRQKGTGRARHGSSRSPIWVGGGVIFAPKPRNYSYKLPKKVRRLAMKSALSSKVQEDQIIVLENLPMEIPKTKEMANILKNLKVDGKALIVMEQVDQSVIRSARNLQGVETALVNTLNVYDILKYDHFIITRNAVEKVEEVYA